MHISEGVLSTQVLIAGWAASGVGVYIGLKKLEPDKIARTALVASAFFLASLIHFKLGPSSAHLTLIAPAGLLLGWQVFPAVLAALFLQAILFNFGGFLVLGANLFIMAAPGLAAYLLFKKLIINNENKFAVIFAFIAGALAVLLAALLAGAALALSNHEFINIAEILFAANLPLALIEGIITALLISWLKRAAPEFLA
ncbi:MAG: cobalt transporter CbiM [Synergistaceae bacterium]|nr:cobalt transporter CbiM [Synergistaceae bacterium]